MNRTTAYVIVTVLLLIACCAAISVVVVAAILLAAFVTWNAPTILITAYAVRVILVMAVIFTFIIMVLDGKELVQGFIEGYKRGSRR